MQIKDLHTSKDVLVLNKPNDKNKAILGLYSWMSKDEFEYYKTIAEELKKHYFLVGLTAGLECGPKELLQYPYTFDLILVPNAAYAQHVMSMAPSYKTKVIIFHETMSKYCLELEGVEKRYDLCSVMNLNHIKLWGVFCDIADERPDLKLRAIATQSSTNGLWKKNYEERLKSTKNIELSGGMVRSKLLETMAASKVFFHPCDFDPGAMVVGEALTANTPILVPSFCSSAIRSFVHPQTGMFYNYSNLFDRINLMLESLDKFSPRKWYNDHYGADNMDRYLKDSFNFYGLGHVESFGFKEWDLKTDWNKKTAKTINGLRKVIES